MPTPQAWGLRDEGTLFAGIAAMIFRPSVFSMALRPFVLPCLGVLAVSGRAPAGKAPAGRPAGGRSDAAQPPSAEPDADRTAQGTTEEGGLGGRAGVTAPGKATQGGPSAPAGHTPGLRIGRRGRR
ncbi:hypothetical protein GCM10023144_18040 [Pigmentiphaga soli]|uniref:Uncharacterized protein n=2 Tax=Pigmentiphaga soli TaxID=1007095 RepID=A0ABP8GV31_9BURK